MGAVKYISDHELTTRAAGTEAAQAAAMGVPFGIFPYSIKGWSALTCRQDVFS